MASAPESTLFALEKFLTTCESIKLISPASSEYESLRHIYVIDQKATPLAIVRPQTAQDVATLVIYCKSHGIKFTIRSGGHSVFGASMSESALTIDMRDISHVNISADKTKATIGGGILTGTLAKILWDEGLATPTGLVQSVGYVGWATYGGYGHLTSQWGLGVDQIVGATIVNSRGQIVEADEDLLSGIRGAGGLFGVIVELTIKVYPLKSILAGMVLFDSHDLKDTFEKVNLNYQALVKTGIPNQLQLLQILMNSPNGKLMGMTFFWGSDDTTTGRRWLTKIEALGNPIITQVIETTIPAWLEGNNNFVAPQVYGKTYTHSIRAMTPEITEIMGRYALQMPEDASTMISTHEMRNVATMTDDTSVFPNREPHFVLEILGTSRDASVREAAMVWAKALWEEIGSTNKTNLLPTTYINLDGEFGAQDGKSLAQRSFGENLEGVLKLKQKYDAENLFELAVPNLSTL